MSDKTYRWGIIGTGHIAEQFAKGIESTARGVRYAVASRSLEKSISFAREHAFEKAYGSYKDLLDDPAVDIVYIATPNHLHYELTMQALNANKHVLCEKPFALDSQQVREMITLAQNKNLFLSEAMWTAFLPSMTTLRKEISEGKIGHPLMVQAEFGIHPEYKKESRLFSPALGGGSIYDIGIYPIFLSLYLLGQPTDIKVTSIPAPTGVDMTTALLFKHAGEATSVLISSFACSLRSDATITGDKGSLRLSRMFHMPTRLYFSKEYADESDETEIPIHYTGNGYNYEADEAMECIDKGLYESPKYTHEFTILLAETIEKVMHQI